ncbi:MAG: type II toxin-antitoxin system VapC family toxin [Burkholderiaceae bacterium]|jgi:predicted nucleic acid-binding protein|nr:type II toxin-antitoxin system VapC family toxin [Burkholderiaceae bacterium]
MGSLENTLAALRGHSVYFDTNVFIYFLKRDKGYFEKCLPFFQAVEEGLITGVSGDLAIAELLVKPISDNDIIGAEKIRALFDGQGRFRALAHDRSTLELAAHIRAAQKLPMIDAIHLATAIKAGCGYIITNDEQVARRAKGIEVIRLES